MEVSNEVNQTKRLCPSIYYLIIDSCLLAAERVPTRILSVRHEGKSDDGNEFPMGPTLLCPGSRDGKCILAD